MNLGECLEKGKIEMKDFFEFVLCSRERRSHFLSVGESYVLAVPVGRRDYVEVEKIKELDFLDRGDFVTERGMVGPIKGNMFIQVSDKGCPKYQFIVGDDVSPEGCLALGRLNEYVQKRIAS